MGYIAGPYTGTHNANALGNVEAGWTVRWTHEGEEIRADNMGLSVQDLVYLGLNCFCDYNLSEYDAAGAQGVFWPYNATKGDIGQVGRIAIASSITAALVLTAVAGTPAATKPATLTGSESIIANGHEVQQLMASNHRKVPISMRLLPDANGVVFVET